MTSDRLYRRVLRPPVDWVMDRIYRMDTRNPVGYDDLGFSEDRGVYYTASDWRALPAFLRAAPVRADDVFVDLGCGKGRVLIQAAAYPFARIIGVELDPDLAALARRNVTNRASHIAIESADVTTWAVPDDVTHVYLYNPFHGAVMDAALRRLRESLERSPRELHIGYFNPVDCDRLIHFGAVLVKSCRLRRGEGYVVEVYRLGKLPMLKDPPKLR
jgi:predicted RNA methylase